MSALNASEVGVAPVYCRRPATTTTQQNVTAQSKQTTLSVVMVIMWLPWIWHRTPV